MKPRVKQGLELEMAESKKKFLDFSKEALPYFDALKEALHGSEKVTPTNGEIFILCMAYGFANGNRVELKSRANTGPRVEYFSREQDLLMAAVQLATTGNAANLSDTDERYLIAEEYAEGGAILLAQELRSQGDFQLDFASRVYVKALDKEAPEIVEED